MSAVICFENVRFSAFLNAVKVLQHLISMGNAFHRLGPPHEKTGHQNWPSSYAEYRANVTISMEVVEPISLTLLRDVKLNFSL